MTRKKQDIFIFIFHQYITGNADDIIHKKTRKRDNYLIMIIIHERKYWHTEKHVVAHAQTIILPVFNT